MVLKIPRKQYVELYGPTKGDRIRLGDTDLVIEIEKDLITYGDELVFGGGKSIRDGMGQASGIKSHPDGPNAGHHQDRYRNQRWIDFGYWQGG